MKRDNFNQYLGDLAGGDQELERENKDTMDKIKKELKDQKK